MKNIREAFGDPIGTYAGETLVGVRDESELMPTTPCSCCGLLPINGHCACETDNGEVCSHCGMMPIEGNCGCMNEDKRKGPSKKTAKKMLRGKKTMTSIMKSTEKWADDPAAAARWLKKRADEMNEEDCTASEGGTCAVGKDNLPAVPPRTT